MWALYECVELTLPAENMLLSISLDGWIRSYTTDPNAALVLLANFLVNVSGLEKVHLDLSSVTGQGVE
ncbi:MAG: hypothetical protein VX670_11000, partial [Candidatus Latescibacterota bacterium]|nr:hypothetical protein [Candidatus Latescibacterota bacterium]